MLIFYLNYVTGIVVILNSCPSPPSLFLTLFPSFFAVMLLRMRSLSYHWCHVCFRSLFPSWLLTHGLCWSLVSCRRDRERKKMIESREQLILKNANFETGLRNVTNAYKGKILLYWHCFSAAANTNANQYRAESFTSDCCCCLLLGHCVCMCVCIKSEGKQQKRQRHERGRNPKTKEQNKLKKGELSTMLERG